MCAAVLPQSLTSSRELHCAVVTGTHVEGSHGAIGVLCRALDVGRDEGKGKGECRAEA